MLTKGSGSSNPGGGIGDGVASSTIIGGFSSVFASVPGTSGYATATNNNIITDMDEFLGLTGGSSSSIADPISTLRPQLNDMELRRRARNNAILAKIQELEANACVQAARSERLRMMRTEYESLVRKYASSGKSRWGTTSNGHLNENNNNNGFPSSRYLLPFNSPQPQQSSYISLKEPDPPLPLVRLSPTTQPLLTTTTSTHPFISSAHPTRDIPSNINPSFATTGVNTEITGPVKPAVIFVSADDNVDDLQQRVLNLERRKVTTIIDSGSQTEAVKLQGETEDPRQQQQQQHQQVAKQVGTTFAKVQRDDGPQASSTTALLLPSPSSSSVPIILDDDGRTTKANQGAIVKNGDCEEKEPSALLLLKERKNIPNRVEMMMMMLDEEDDESSYQEEQARRKQQFENLHQQLNHPKPKSYLQDDTNSISSPPSTSAAEMVSTSNATDEIRFKRQRQYQQQQQRHVDKVVAEHEKKGNTSKEKMKKESSQDTTTISLANNNNKSKNNKDGNNTDKQVTTVAHNTATTADLSEKIMFRDDDISLSDSTSVFQIRKNEKERKKLLEQLAATSAKNSHMKNKRKMDRNGIRNHGDDEEDDEEEEEEGGRDQPEDSQSDNGSEEVGKEKFSKKSENNKRTGADDMHSSPTAGATSESIGDSMMDSFHKTPDAQLPRDDSELHEIAEVNEKEHGEMEEIELVHKVSFGVAHNTYADEVDDVLVVTATAVSADTKGQPSGGGGGGGIKELEVHERQINDAEEIRPNNLSSSKVDVPAEEEENFTHANNPGEPNAGITFAAAAAAATNSAITLQENALIHPNKENIMEDEMEEAEKKNPAVAFYKDVEHPMDKKMTVQKNSAFVDSHFQGKQQIVSGGDSGSTGTRLNESNKKRGMILHSSAPSANMSAHSSTTSSFTSGSNAVENVGENIALFPPSLPASTNLPQRHSSTESSSTSSSRQHSLDDQVDGNETIANGNHNISQTKEQSSSGSHHGSPQVKKIQQQQHQKSPTLTQSVHKRHQQLQQQVREKEKEATPPVGADAMPERLSTSSDSFSSIKSPMLVEADIAPATNASVDINNGRKVSLLEKGGGGGGGVASVKTTKGSPVLGPVPTLTSSPSLSSLKKIAGNTNQASSPNGNTNISGNGNGVHSTSPGTRPASSGGKTTAKNSSMIIKQGQQSSPAAVTIPSGPTGGQNTARRLKLKLHDDSDTDSSEIGSVKSTPLIKGGNLSGNQGNASSGSGHQSHSIINSSGSSNNKNHDVSDKTNTEKKFTEVDDDFDDFYDNF